MATKGIVTPLVKSRLYVEDIVTDCVDNRFLITMLIHLIDQCLSILDYLGSLNRLVHHSFAASVTICVSSLVYVALLRLLPSFNLL